MTKGLIGGPLNKMQRESITIEAAKKQIISLHEESMLALEIYDQVVQVILEENLFGIAPDCIRIAMRNMTIPLLQFGDVNIAYQSGANKILLHGNGSFEFEFNDNWPEALRTIAKAQEYAERPRDEAQCEKL